MDNNISANIDLAQQLCGMKEVKTMSDGKKKYYELLSERYHWCIDCGYIGGEHEGAYCDDCKEYWRELREAREEANDER